MNLKINSFLDENVNFKIQRILNKIKMFSFSTLMTSQIKRLIY